MLGLVYPAAAMDNSPGYPSFIKTGWPQRMSEMLVIMRKNMSHSSHRNWEASAATHPDAVGSIIYILQ